jgi:ribosomal protein S18 acetylase RimI-like enzyme
MITEKIVTEKPPVFIRRLELRDLPKIDLILHHWIKDRRTGEVVITEIQGILNQMGSSLLPDSDLAYNVALDMEGAVTGVVGIRPVQDPIMSTFLPIEGAAELFHLYRDPNAEGPGIGTALVLAAQETAKERGHTQLGWNSGPRYRNSAWGFYDKLDKFGFQPLGVAMNYYNYDSSAPKEALLEASYDYEAGIERGDARVWGKVL